MVAVKQKQGFLKQLLISILIVTISLSSIADTRARTLADEARIQILDAQTALQAK